VGQEVGDKGKAEEYSPPVTTLRHRAYYLRHRNEMEAYLKEEERQGDAFREKQESKYGRQGIRDRLLARYSCIG
jgi:hypothetical protein